MTHVITFPDNLNNRDDRAILANGKVKSFASKADADKFIDSIRGGCDDFIIASDSDLKAMNDNAMQD